MQPMICIDFGNTYTKVAIRANRNSSSQMLRDASLTFDETNICIPTLASRLCRNGKETWLYGNDVIQIRTASPDLKVYRNWKPHFFRGVETHLLEPAPALVAVAANGKKSSKLADEEWVLIKKLLRLGDEDRGAIELLMARRAESEVPTPTESPIATVEETDLEIKNIGLGYFRWLKEFVRPVCTKLGLGSIEEIPARITLPSFGSASKAELLLREILDEAGWHTDRKVPSLAEPLANAIGTFSEGVNAIHRPKRATEDMPHYGVMFENTGLVKVMREAILENGPKVSWVMIVDLGGYTLDFAMVALDLQDIDARIEGTVDGMSRSAMHSEPIGVTTLDRRIKDVLDPKKRTAFQEIEAEPDQKRLESLHKIIYGKERPAKYKGVTIGEGAEFKRMLGCLEQFSEEIADCAQKFLEIHQYERIDDLIITGGGSMIPCVRKALKKRLEQPYGVRKFHLYTDAEPELNTHKLNADFVRGATALGGASVYFDFAQ